MALAGARRAVHNGPIRADCPAGATHTNYSLPLLRQRAIYSTWRLPLVHIGSERQEYILTIETLTHPRAGPSDETHSTLIGVNLSGTDDNRVTTAHL